MDRSCSSFLFDNRTHEHIIGKLSNDGFLFESILIRPHKGYFSSLTFAGLANATANGFGLIRTKESIGCKVGLIIGQDLHYGFDRPGHRCIHGGGIATIIPGGATLIGKHLIGNVGFEGSIGNMWMTILSTIGTKEQIGAPPVIGFGLDGNLGTIMGPSTLFDIVGIISGPAITVFFKADRRGPFFLFTSTRVSDLVDKFQFVITTLRGEGGRIFHHFTRSAWIECTKTVK
mmetsp:Transcript_18568/g.21284  ORF Transcript_18568/g.21284 Transcript_18568/m.21284 type:complete len:231 (-) Transcript_18568:122-814(-)